MIKNSIFFLFLIFKTNLILSEDLIVLKASNESIKVDNINLDLYYPNKNFNLKNFKQNSDFFFKLNKSECIYIFDSKKDTSIKNHLKIKLSTIDLNFARYENFYSDYKDIFTGHDNKINGYIIYSMAKRYLGYSLTSYKENKGILQINNTKGPINKLNNYNVISINDSNFYSASIRKNNQIYFSKFSFNKGHDKYFFFPENINDLTDIFFYTKPFTAINNSLNIKFIQQIENNQSFINNNQYFESFYINNELFFKPDFNNIDSFSLEVDTSKKCYQVPQLVITSLEFQPNLKSYKNIFDDYYLLNILDDKKIKDKIIRFNIN